MQICDDHTLQKKMLTSCYCCRCSSCQLRVSPTENFVTVHTAVQHGIFAKQALRCSGLTPALRQHSAGWTRPLQLCRLTQALLWRLQWWLTSSTTWLLRLTSAANHGMPQMTSTVMQPPTTTTHCRRTSHCRSAYRRRLALPCLALMGCSVAARRRQLRPTHGADLHNPLRQDRRD